MKIKKDEIKKFKKILKNVPYNPIGDLGKQSLLFFPLDMSKERDLGGLVLNTNTSTVDDLCVPGLVLLKNNDGKVVVELAYSNTKYSAKIDILDYSELTGGKLGKSEKEDLSDIDCFLVKKEYIFSVFEI